MQNDRLLGHFLDELHHMASANHDPELLQLISHAIKDAHVFDPVGDAHQNLEAEDFAWATRAIAAVARRHCGGRIVSSLEGGYGLEALGRSAVAHVRALAED